MCRNQDCLRNQRGQLLKKAEQRQAILYTFDKGALAAYTVHLYCECKTLFIQPKDYILIACYQAATLITTTTTVFKKENAHITTAFQK